MFDSLLSCYSLFIEVHVIPLWYEIMQPYYYVDNSIPLTYLHVACPAWLNRALLHKVNLLSLISATVSSLFHLIATSKKCWRHTFLMFSTLYRPSHTTKIFTKIFLKIRFKNLCLYTKLLKKLLQL